LPLHMTSLKELPRLYRYAKAGGSSSQLLAT
jgi:hypothetical protein